MAQTRRTKKRNPLQSVLLIALVLIAVVALVLTLGKGRKPSAEVTAIQEGLDFLSQQEEKDPDTVRQARQALYVRRMEAQKEELIEKLDSGGVDPFSLFQDYAVLGDSRAVGFWYRDFLEKSRVLADGGHTIRNVEKQLDTLVSLNPSMIYMCYGLNDTSIGYWDTAEEYVTEYIQVVKSIQERLPNATIVVSSILPAKDPAFERSKKWYNIPEWSAALEKACASNGILFANCDYLAVSYPNLWDPDGIHFRKEFYPHWARYLLVATLMEE